MAWVSAQVTIASTGVAQQLFPPSSPTAQVFARQVIIQNNSANIMRIGDATVSATKGIYIAAGPGGGSINTGPAVAYNSYLSDFWVAGTATTLVDIFYNT